MRNSIFKRHHLLKLAVLLSIFALIGCGGGGGGDDGSSDDGSTSVNSEQWYYGNTDEGGEVHFYVNDSRYVNGSEVEGFEIYMYLTGGSAGSGWLWMAIDPALTISGNSFTFNNGSYQVNGTFTDSTTCTGTWDYRDPYMGYSNGAWTASIVPILSVTPTYQDVTSQSGSTSFTVTNASEGSGTMSWAAESAPNDTWISIISGSSGTDTGTISVNYGENIEGDARIGTITISSHEAYNSPQTVEIRQRVYNPFPEYKLIASDEKYDAKFGWSVDISGNYAIIGSWGDNENRGSAYLYEWGGDQWVQKAKLTASDGESYDHFGQSVSISGDYIVVGAVLGNGSSINSGSAYIYKKPTSGWTDMTETAKLTASDGLKDDYFGSSVCIFGDYIVIGAKDDDNSYAKTGSAYIFEKPIGGWSNMTETAKLTASDAYDTDYFGSSVSISGNYVIIGAFDNDYMGAAYIFEKPISGWTNMTETAKLTASDGDMHDRFGESVSISGDTAIVGAYWNDSNGDDSGSAYIFEKPISGWTNMTETAKLTASDAYDSDYFGISVSISGDTVIVGAYSDDSNGDDSGSAYIFEKPVGGWSNMTETSKLTSSDGEKWDKFGYSVSISGDTAIVGAYNDCNSQNYSGSAYIYILQ